MSARVERSRVDSPASEVDVLVIGAGVVGIATAYSLARRGLSVVIVEREREPARGTSYANGGQLSYVYTDALAQPSLVKKMPGLVAGLDPAFRIRIGIDPDFIRWTLQFMRNCTDARFTENTLAALQLGLESRLAMHELLEQHALEFAHAAPGKMIIYRDAKSLARAREVAVIKSAAGIEQRFLGPEEAIGLEPALADGGAFEGVLWSPEEEVGDPYLFCQALLGVLKAEYGVRTAFGMNVTGLHQEPSRVTIAGSDGEVLTAKTAVVCLGPQAASFLGGIGIRVPIQPMKGYSFTAAPGINAPRISLTDAGRKIVFCQLGDCIRVAGLAELGNWSTLIDDTRMASLIDGARAAMPHAAAYDQSTRHWVGLRPMTPNSLPIIRQETDNLFLNVGHGMLGWTFALGAADRVGALIRAHLAN